MDKALNDQERGREGGREGESDRGSRDERLSNLYTSLYSGRHNEDVTIRVRYDTRSLVTGVAALSGAQPATTGVIEDAHQVAAARAHRHNNTHIQSIDRYACSVINRSAVRDARHVATVLTLCHHTTASTRAKALSSVTSAMHNSTTFNSRCSLPIFHGRV